MKNIQANLRVLEQSIVPVYEGKEIQGGCETEQLINARELYEFIESKQEFSNWIKARLNEVDAIENIDYATFDFFVKREDSNLGTKRIDYILKIDIAKEIAMLERNAKGKMVRRYFIEAEKRFREEKLTRARSKAERRIFTDVLKEVLPESPNKKWAYKYFTDLVYKIVTGKNAKQLRELYGLSKDDSVRACLSPQEIKEVMNYERIIESLLEFGQDYEGVKTILSNPNLLNPAKAV
ncbi:MAG: antA/AntB antirepressor family protein [Clostridiaceae bacterium]